MTKSRQDLADSVAEAARGKRHVVFAAESVTAGSVSMSLAAGAGASEWFAGGIVAYSTELKRRLLGVTVGDVLTPECAREMALGGLAASGASLVVAVTGVGGPDSMDGHPAGEVHICAGGPLSLRTFTYRFAGSPSEIVEQATLRALAHVRDSLDQESGTLRPAR